VPAPRSPRAPPGQSRRDPVLRSLLGAFLFAVKFGPCRRIFLGPQSGLPAVRGGGTAAVSKGARASLRTLARFPLRRVGKPSRECPVPTQRFLADRPPRTPSATL
jgi:hypothetical protein